jgi:hypothetical protein
MRKWARPDADRLAAEKIAELVGGRGGAAGDAGERTSRGVV